MSKSMAGIVKDLRTVKYIHPRVPFILLKRKKLNLGRTLKIIT